MSAALVPGMRVRLPSGNIVRLQGAEGGEWLCEYEVDARARGAVVFTAKFLLAFGQTL